MKKKMLEKLIACLVLVVFTLSILGVYTFSKTSSTSQKVSTQKKVTIEFFHTTWVPGMLKVLEESIKAFEKKYPNIQIKETRVSWTDAPSQLMTSIMGGRAPDIVICNPPMVAYLRDIGALADITDMIPKSMLQSFLPAALKIVTNQKGRIDGLPQEGCTWQLFYRKDLFQKAGLDPNKPPQTWDELVKYGMKLTKDLNNDGVIDQWGFGWPVQAENANDYWVNFMQQAGAKVSVYDAKQKRWVSKLLDPEAVKGTQFMVDLVRKYKISPPTLVDMDWEAVTNGFVSGKFAMMYNGAWVVGSVHQKGPKIEGKWGTALMVAGPGGRASRGYPNTFNILQASTKKKESWQYLYFLYTTKMPNGLTYAEAYCKGADSLLWTKSYIEYAKKTYEPLLQPFIEGTKYSVIPPMDPKWETFKALYVGKTIQQMLMGQKDVQQGLKELHDALEQLHRMK
ncbi:ABC transporter substrate-binding protein [Anaerocellum diazotrophicum]|uniref:ABC transporter substrate-binding protein n=1 Tax=Caldicellulosiruptor diazotrophicus TaxID=2806205 RepID=A0ABM7NJB0_9FIRM|nr:sugar ABC transporter substrate-binding protein [Caldicellulosiruptor diazotrophicus]BCS80188.1 ABC transporter substrate-binding protein [Caldicellulosiruptor diazotrophicus]